MNSENSEANSTEKF